VRQSIVLYSGARSFGRRCVGSAEACDIALQPFYDVVERVVVFRAASGLRLSPGRLYHVELVAPGDDPNAFGFRAFDGAPLAKENAVPLKFSFLTARSAPTPIVAEEPPTCFDAWSAFSQSGCSSAICHAGRAAPMGLRLDSRAGLRDTAIGHVAHEVDDGPVAGRPLLDPGRFGTAMPVIDPGNPGTSYLLYKLLARPENFGPECGTRHQVPLEGGCATPSDAEVRRLRDRLVRLEPMPLGGTLVGGKATLDILERYILAGAETDSCP
jgi:hypothetical protein